MLRRVKVLMHQQEQQQEHGQQQDSRKAHVVDQLPAAINPAEGVVATGSGHDSGYKALTLEEFRYALLLPAYCCAN
jgi:hypothetical protein